MLTAFAYNIAFHFKISHKCFITSNVTTYLIRITLRSFFIQVKQGSNLELCDSQSLSRCELDVTAPPPMIYGRNITMITSRGTCNKPLEMLLRNKHILLVYCTPNAHYVSHGTLPMLTEILGKK